MFDVRASVCVLGLGLLLGFSAPATAQANLSATNDPSLVLLIWDPVAKVSYSRDTGLLGSSLYNGLSDAGSQQFWTIDPSTDTSFAQFSKVSTDLSKDIWMVIGGGKGAGTVTGTNNVFSTMVNTVLGDDGQPVLNPQWGYLTGVNNGLLRSTTGLFGGLYNSLGSGNGTAFNNYGTAAPGTASSFDSSASNAYVGNLQPVLSDALTGLSAGEAMFGGNGTAGQGFDTGNVIGANGSSSWFYYMTPSSTTASKPLNSSAVIVSAFSNSAELAYWGLARTTNTGNQQELVLSFTLPSAITPASTTLGILRRNQTDYSAQYGSAVLVGSSDEFVGWTPSPLLDVTSAVPEPESVLLMALGLGGVLAAVRRARRRHSHA